jgi:hypothetical protein
VYLPRRVQLSHGNRSRTVNTFGCVWYMLQCCFSAGVSQVFFRPSNIPIRPLFHAVDTRIVQILSIYRSRSYYVTVRLRHQGSFEETSRSTRFAALSREMSGVSRLHLRLLRDSWTKPDRVNRNETVEPWHQNPGWENAQVSYTMF